MCGLAYLLPSRQQQYVPQALSSAIHVTPPARLPSPPFLRPTLQQAATKSGGKPPTGLTHPPIDAAAARDSISRQVVAIPHTRPEAATPANPPASADRPVAPANGDCGDAGCEDDSQTCRQLRFEEDATSVSQLQALVDEFNKNLAEQGLAHKQVALTPVALRGGAAPPATPSSAARGSEGHAAAAHTPRTDTPLSKAAAGAAAWPQAGQEQQSPATADDVQRLHRRLSQLEAHSAKSPPAPPAMAAAAAAVAPVAASPAHIVPAGAMYVTHKELELSQENQALKAQLQQVLMATGAATAPAPVPSPGGWVTTTRGSAAVESSAADSSTAHQQELWMPASVLAGPWTPLLSGKGGGGMGISVTAARGAPRGSVTPGSEGSVKTSQTTPGSGGGVGGARGVGARASAGRSPAAPMGLLNVRAASAAGSPSKGSSSGTPRDRVVAVLSDSKLALEQIKAGLNVSRVFRGVRMHGIG